MALPRFLRPIINWASHAISRGLTILGIRGQAEQRFPDIAAERIREAIDLGQQAVENAIEANRLPIESPLREALRGRQPIDDDVSVRFLIGLTDASGRLDFMSLRINAPWGYTLGELIDVLEGTIRSRLGQSPGLSIDSINIIPPFLLGSGRAFTEEQVGF